MIADIAIKFDYVMYPAIVGAAGLALTVVVRVLRQFDLSAFPFWAVLMVAGAGAFGFAIGDMPSDPKMPEPPTYNLVGSDRVKAIETHYAYLKEHPYDPKESEPRALPRWADGALCVGGIGMFTAGLVLMICRLYDRYGKAEKPFAGMGGTITGTYHRLTEIAKKMEFLEGLKLDGLVKEMSAHLNILHEKIKVVESKLGDSHKTNARIVEAMERMDGSIKIIGKAIEPSLPKPIGNMTEEPDKGKTVYGVAYAGCYNDDKPAKPIRKFSGPLPEGWHDIFDEKPPKGAKCWCWYDTDDTPLRSWSDVWDGTKYKSHPTTPEYWCLHDSAKEPEPAKEGELVKWCERKPKPGRKIRWTHDPLTNPIKPHFTVFTVVEDGDDAVKSPTCISSGWAATRGHLDSGSKAVWTYADVPVPSVSDDGWTRWEAKRPEVGRIIRCGGSDKKPHDCNKNRYKVIDDGHIEHIGVGQYVFSGATLWWKYDDIPEVAASEWVSFKDRKPEPGRQFNWKEGKTVFGSGDPELIEMKADDSLVYVNDRLKGKTPPSMYEAAYYGWQWRYAV